MVTSHQLLDLFSRTSEGMIAIDALSRIVAWNEAAVDIFGYRPEEVEGKCCAQVLRWRDRNLTFVCGPECPIKARAANGLITETQTVMAITKTGTSIWLSVSTLLLPREHHRICRLVHFVRETGLPKQEDTVLADEGSGEGTRLRKPVGRLTRREGEVLDLLTRAMGTVEIANRLGVSRTTIRNHVQRILAKLEVHNRAEAIAMALWWYR